MTRTMPNLRPLLALVAALALSGLTACQASGGDAPEEAAGESEPTAGPADETPDPEAEATAPSPDGDSGAATADEAVALDSGVVDAAASPMRPIYSFLANRQLSHGIIGDGFVGRLGAPDGGKYIRGSLGRSWHLRESVVDDVSVMIPLTKRVDKLNVPLTEAQAGVVDTLVVRLYNPVPSNEITFAINERALEVRPLDDVGWSVVRIPVPDGTLRTGENEIALKVEEIGRIGEHKTGVGLAALALLPEAQAAEVSLEATQPDLVAGVGLGFEAGRGAAWYVMVPEGAHLELGFHSSGGCALEVRASAASRPDVPPVEARLVGSPEMPRRRVDLSSLSGAVARVELFRPRGDCGASTIDHPQLMVPGEPVQMPADVPPPKYVVIWLIDTLRADHLPFYNPDTDVHTPRLSKFVEESTLFERVYCEGNESKVSHASLFTGQLPISHRHYRSSTQVRESDELLPEAMRRAGRTTAGFVSNGYISDKWGFEQGWDRFVNTIREGRSVGADNLMRIASPWLEAHKDDPFFVYFGTIDPHVHYFRHKEFIDRYDPDDSANMASGKPFVWKVSGNQLADIAAGRLEVDEADKKRMVALYKNEISFNDKHFGRMLDKLDELGIREQTMIVVVADHGEEFFEHGGVGHARTLYQHTVQIPLIAYYPPLFPKGHRVAEGADMIDIYYTIAKYTGIDPLPEKLQGGDLAMQAQGVDAGYPRPTTATMGSRRYAMRLADYKLVTEYNGEDKLHAIVDDPWEETDLSESAEHRDALRWARDVFGLYITRRSDWSKAEWGVASNLRRPIPDPEP